MPKNNVAIKVIELTGLLADVFDDFAEAVEDESKSREEVARNIRDASKAFNEIVKARFEEITDQ